MTAEGEPGRGISPIKGAALVVLVCLAVYSNTLGVPFQWDELSFLVDNPAFKDASVLLEPGALRGTKYYASLITRPVGYLTFALNYRVHGLGVAGYHIVNIAVHILASLMVYILVLLTFRTPVMGGSAIKERSGTVALMAALLFAAHPVQTEAVTYIFQRLASLAAMFYLLSLVSYAGSRLSGNTAAKAGLYAVSLISAVLAMKTKENAFTLPLAVALYEFFFLDGRIKRRLLWLAPMLLTMLVVPLSLAVLGRPPGEVLGVGTVGAVLDAAKGAHGYGYTRAEYLFTQFRVMVTYLRLMVWPVGQTIDYGYQVSRSFFSLGVVASLWFLLSLITSGVVLAVLSIRHDPSLRLVAFGIFWFFLTLSVESSVIPIPMLINEYRMYLPSAGLLAGAVAGLFLLAERARCEVLRSAVVYLLVIAVAVFAVAAYKRNSVWGSRVGLWEDAAAKAPGNVRVHFNLGHAYRDAGKILKSLGSFKAAYALSPLDPDINNELGLMYRLWKDDERALVHLLVALRSRPGDSNVLNNLGLTYNSMGRVQDALAHYRAAIIARPGNYKAHFNLGMAYMEMDKMQEAAREFREVLRIKPNDPDADRFLDYVLGRRG